MYFHFNILSGRKLRILSFAFILRHSEIVTENAKKNQLQRTELLSATSKNIS